VIVLAHVGHWLVDMLYVVPLIFMGVLIAIGKMRERRSRGGK
jgi:cytochrome c oxidase assembly factor CtaG